MRPLRNITGATAGSEAYKEMKQRIITGAVLLVAILVLSLAAPKWVMALLWGCMMSIGSYELLFRTGLVQEPRLVVWAAAAAFGTALWSYFGAVYAWGVLGIIAFCMVLFLEMMLSHVKINYQKVAMTFMAGCVIPYMLCSVIRIHTMTIGRYVVLIPFIVACINDTGAYFAGMFLGRHKLAPVISPKKTVEGAVGGVLAAMIVMLLYTLILGLAFDFYVNYGYALLYGLLGALVGIFGDLCFSVIKRQTGIKDYGNLIPGHGGVLDRVDSMVLVGPLMEALLILIPVAVGK